MTAVFAFILMAAGLTTATATAHPSIDPRIFDSGNKWAIAQNYGAVLTQAYVDGHLKAIPLVYAAQADVASAKKANPGKMVIDVDQVYTDRQTAIFVPAFKLGVQARDFEAVTDPGMSYRPGYRLPIHQVFVAGAIVRELGQMSGLSVAPDSKDDKALDALLHQTAANFPKEKGAYTSLKLIYDNGVAIGLSNVY